MACHTPPPGPAVAPVAEGSMYFTADGGKTSLCLENEWLQRHSLVQYITQLGQSLGVLE